MYLSAIGPIRGTLTLRLAGPPRLASPSRVGPSRAEPSRAEPQTAAPVTRTERSTRAAVLRAAWRGAARSEGRFFCCPLLRRAAAGRGVDSHPGEVRGDESEDPTVQLDRSDAAQHGSVRSSAAQPGQLMYRRLTRGGCSLVGSLTTLKRNLLAATGSGIEVTAAAAAEVAAARGRDRGRVPAGRRVGSALLPGSPVAQRRPPRP